MSPLAILGLGFVLGLRHALDADHVVAVATLTSRSRNVFAAAWLGIAWGIGHTVTLFTAGAAIIVFNLVIPARVALALELVVGMALLLLGAMNLRRRPRVDHATGMDAPGVPTLRAFLVGLVHGLAGSAAAVLLVLAAIRDPRAACGYLAVFGMGTLVGMTVITTTMGLPLGSLRGRGWGRGIQVATGVASLALGGWLVYQIGWVNGLFVTGPLSAGH